MAYVGNPGSNKIITTDASGKLTPGVVGDGLSLSGGQLTGGWQTTYEVNFTTLTPVASYSNGTATIDGKTWTFDGLGANSIASLSNANGLQLQSNANSSTYTDAQVKLSDLSAMPGLNEILIWARFNSTLSTSGGSDSNTNMSLAYIGGSSLTIVPRFRLGWYSTGTNGAPSGTSFHCFGYMAGTIYPSSGNEFSSYTTANTNHDVWLIRVVSSNISEVYTGSWSSGWPAFSSLQFRNYFMINAVAPPGAATSPFGNPNNATVGFYASSAGATSANTVAKLLNLRVQVK